jgi:hypothetical protein
MIENNNAITNNGINANSYNTPKCGVHHVFKSTTTSSSNRVHIAYYNATTVSNMPLSKNAKKRRGKKRKKMEKLEHAEWLGHKSIALDYLEKETIFFSGTSERIVPNHVPKTRVLSAIEDLTVFDTVNGGQMILNNGDYIFILVP